MANDKRINVLMVSLPFQGHINPFLKLAKRLISKGVHVTIATTENARHRLPKMPNSQSSEIHLEFFSDGLSFDFDRSDQNSLINSLYTKGSKNLSTLITNLTKAQEFSCMIVNPFVPWAIDVANEHGIPCAMLWIQASAVFSIYYRYFKNTGDDFQNLEDPNEKVQLPGLPTFKVRDLPTLMLPSSPDHFKRLLMHLYQSLDKVKWVFGTSFYEAEEEIVKSMVSLTPIYPIGPLVSPFLLGETETNVFSVDLWNAEYSCIEWLDNKPNSSVIYVSFGSLIVLSNKNIENIATALKNSNKPFLWVLNPGAENKEGGADELAFEILKETKGRGLVVKWCQQERVLMHPSVACFVSHCGWNSTLETLVAGVPVIACPEWTDQPTNAVLVSNVFKTGVNAKSEEHGVINAQELQRCIWEVMDGPNAEEIKNRAMEMKDLARKALQEGGSSDKHINQFIHDMIIHNLHP
ncbi:hypothetical protein HN51_001037 [Arachis hypogaea]|uniref:Glycosyltransferase n=4 Tax=Arachis hypogaea TaxID=3818 RepID=A0A445ETR4_ARAHY|nr:UDP-glycosyltransferase 84B2-like [Arachis hypogaea]QHO49074.1 UDP-glycosyltransferase [Arachis hypogaea]RYR78717.1 hypothetical protein Ahy_A01g003573 isoform A [Arachis hypogaea]